MKSTYKDVRSRIERKIELEARMLEDHSASKIKQKLVEDWISNRQYKWDGEAWREKPLDEIAAENYVSGEIAT